MNESSLEANDEPLIKKSEDNNNDIKNQSNEVSEIDTHENNNQVNGNNANKNEQKELCALCIKNDKVERLAGTTLTNNHIMIWYTLKQTMEILRRKPSEKQLGSAINNLRIINETLKTILDEKSGLVVKLTGLVDFYDKNNESKHANKNEHVITNENKKINKENINNGNISEENINEENNIITDKKNDKENKEKDNINNENEEKIEENDLKLDAQLDDSLNNCKGIENQLLDEMLKTKPKELQKSHQELIKQLADESNKYKKQGIKDNTNESDSPGKSDSNGKISLIESMNNKENILNRNDIVFLSKAMQEFKKNVEESKISENATKQANAAKQYNKNIESLDKILEPVIETLVANNCKINEKVDLKTLNELEKRLDDQNIKEEKNVEKKEEKKEEDKEEDKKVAINELMVFVKSKLSLAATLEQKSKYLQNIAQTLKLSEEQQKKVADYAHSAGKTLTEVGLSNKYKGNLQSLTKLNSDQINEIENNNPVNSFKTDENTTQMLSQFSEYDQDIVNDFFKNGKLEDNMSNFINDLLFGNPENFNKAHGKLDGILTQYNFSKALQQMDNTYLHPAQNNQNLDEENIIIDESNISDTPGLKNKPENDIEKPKSFVDQFIEKLFITDNDNWNESSISYLSNNMETLGKDKNFCRLVQEMTQSNFVVDTINTKFKDIEKQFKKAGYDTTTRGVFKKKFWDENLKGHILDWSDGKWKKNLTIIGIEGLLGYGIGTVLAGMAGVGFTGFLPGLAAALIIVATIVAVAVLIALVRTIYQGWKERKDKQPEGLFDKWFKADKDTIEITQNAQKGYLQQIYKAFVALGCNEKAVEALMKQSNNKDFDKSPQGKCLKTMKDMGEFLKNNLHVLGSDGAKQESFKKPLSGILNKLGIKDNIQK